ncbi:hypothetical protein [Hymenobacter lucidus]|uniref:Outer membrane protein beta-barrel domain-containing protein n=1 Tax=Hymenobacter lucidus TaxID=2880930 RepID=A0ABS8ALY3_9BACT|nr:hypothetical protein [Hymenobacter lucidus]MCB2407210.1 hypothetical protein [Hymenobacter lucidus]
MRTPDMSDEELDALFQQSADNYPDEHNLSAWLQMERKLEEAAVQQLVRQRVLRIFALETLALAVGLLVWLGFSAQTPLPKLAAGMLTTTDAKQTKLALAAAQTKAARPAAVSAQTSNSRSASPKTPAVPVAKAVAAATQPAAAPASAAEVTAPEATKNSAHPQHQLRPAKLHPALVLLPVQPTRKPKAMARREAFTASDYGTVSATITVDAPSRRNHPLPAQALLLPVPKSETPVASVPETTSGHSGALAPAAARHISQDTPTSPVPAPAVPVSSAETVAPEAAVAAAIRPGSEPLPDRNSGATLPDSAAPTAVEPIPAVLAPRPAIVQPDSTQQPEKPRRTKPTYRFSVGLMYAPELSTVRWEKTTAVGSNLGIMAEYRLTNRLRINAAAIRSVKRYIARGSDYHPPTGYWSNNYDIDVIDATCRITEVPINLRYDVLQRANTTVFASVGLSSLLMRHERYLYSYQYYGKPATKDWSLAKGSNHWLSVVNLSAGYERSLPGRWSLQGEPFVKVPLGGVGFGKVKLSSAGVFFSLKYSLLPTAPASVTP